MHRWPTLSTFTANSISTSSCTSTLEPTSIQTSSFCQGIRDATPSSRPQKYFGILVSLPVSIPLYIYASIYPTIAHSFISLVVGSWSVGPWNWAEWGVWHAVVAHSNAYIPVQITHFILTFCSGIRNFINSAKVVQPASWPKQYSPHSSSSSPVRRPLRRCSSVDLATPILVLFTFGFCPFSAQGLTKFRLAFKINRLFVFNLYEARKRIKP